MFEGLFQPMHLIVILAIVLLLFGPSKLAGLGKGLGDAIRGFKSSMREGETPATPVITKPAIAQNDANLLP
jgi:sec-independent protein translocase protein TatA